jgi:hypothetical protein
MFKERIDPKNALAGLITAVALVIVVIHLAFPDLAIDGVTVVLLLFAVAPWLSPIFKSIEFPGGLKFEFQELKRDLEEVRGAARNAENKAEFALIQKEQQYSADMQQLTTSDAKQEFDQQAELYKEIRNTQKAGSLRTSNMTEVISKMIALAPRLEHFDVNHALISGDIGERLSGYAYLFARPDFSQLSALVNSVTKIETKPFSQYWGIQAIEKVIDSEPQAEVDTGILEALRTFQSRLPRGSDRYYALSRILQAHVED